ncbi:hypothetical protein IWZ00DRAFT_493559 [Phyllosticta capitalensis]|uniref:uncharacterized protein n=1 Tax=Phyllosticta capitalensis TaxID=121624 RepID=UPI00312E6E4B
MVVCPLCYQESKANSYQKSSITKAKWADCDYLAPSTPARTRATGNLKTYQVNNDQLNQEDKNQNSVHSQDSPSPEVEITFPSSETIRNSSSPSTSLKGLPTPPNTTSEFKPHGPLDTYEMEDIVPSDICFSKRHGAYRIIAKGHDEQWNRLYRLHYFERDFSKGNIGYRFNNKDRSWGFLNPDGQIYWQDGLGEIKKWLPADSEEWRWRPVSKGAKEEWRILKGDVSPTVS